MKAVGELEVTFANRQTPQVELLLMKALSLSLIKGVICGVDSTVNVSRPTHTHTHARTHTHTHRCSPDANPSVPTRPLAGR